MLTSITENLGEAIRHVLTPLVMPVMERNLIPDIVIRLGIQREIAMELVKVNKLTSEQKLTKQTDFIDAIKLLPIAIEQKRANEQHYEVPDVFYHMVLGPRLKYSCGYWRDDNSTLQESEIAMLEMYCERAELKDGMKIVDLGCGWGSVTLYVAEKYPNSQITAISNSNSQREYIVSAAKSRGLSNVTVLTGDINSFDLPEEYMGMADRVISIEMFEHMKNYGLLMQKIARWIKPQGKLFVHIFCHREVPGHYESGWLTDNFFTGGTLPSDSLLLYFQEDLRIERHWRVNGRHYQRTLEAWLKEMDRKKAEVIPLLEKCYGVGNGVKWYVYWRLFFIGCAEFFGAAAGEEYFVSHYLFTKN